METPYGYDFEEINGRLLVRSPLGTGTDPAPKGGMVRVRFRLLPQAIVIGGALVDGAPALVSKINREPQPPNDYGAEQEIIVPESELPKVRALVETDLAVIDECRRAVVSQMERHLEKAREQRFSMPQSMLDVARGSAAANDARGPDVSWSDVAWSYEGPTNWIQEFNRRMGRTPRPLCDFAEVETLPSPLEVYRATRAQEADRIRAMSAPSVDDGRRRK